MRQKQSGQSLVEYGLIGTLILVVSISGLSLLGGALQLGLSDLVASLEGDGAPPTGSPVATPAASSGGGGATPGASTGGLSPAGGAGPIVYAPSHSTPSGAIMVTGANGSSVHGKLSSAASKLQAIADKLEAAGLEPTLLKHITQLALDGHATADKFAESGQFPYISGFQDSLKKVNYYATEFFPDALSSADLAAINNAAGEIDAAVKDYQAHGGDSAAMASGISDNSNTVCATGGDTSECLR